MGLLPGTTTLDQLPAEEPQFTKRMECLAVDSVKKIPASDQWIREIKWDGYRVCGSEEWHSSDTNQGKPGAECALQAH
jgi:hypothetical protein